MIFDPCDIMLPMSSKERQIDTKQKSLTFREYFGAILPPSKHTSEKNDKSKPLSFREYIGVNPFRKD